MARKSSGGSAVGPLALLVCLAAAGCSSSEPASGSSDTSPPPAVVEDVGVRDHPEAGPAVPESGALVGVAPDIKDHSVTGRLGAFSRFERQAGQKLDIAHVFHPWGDEFPDAVDRELAGDGRALLLSWGGYDTRVIVSGGQDHVIRARARAVASWAQPVLLRWRWEMDRPNLQSQVWSGQDYVAAWNHIRRIFEEEGATNVGWVWCPHAKGFSDSGRRAQDYYPGDRQVDWLCASVYGENGVSFREAALPFLNWAAPRGKPIIIGEFGVLRGDRARWLDEAAEFIRGRSQIKAVVYFDYYHRNKDSDHRLSRSPDAVRAFRRMVDSEHFGASAESTAETGRAGSS